MTSEQWNKQMEENFFLKNEGKITEQEFEKRYDKMLDQMTKDALRAGMKRRDKVSLEAGI